jgi:hypothetical protein
MLESMDVLGINIHAWLLLKEVILIVLYGLENMDVIGTHIHVLVQLAKVI